MYFSTNTLVENCVHDNSIDDSLMLSICCVELAAILPITSAMLSILLGSNKNPFSPLEIILLLSLTSLQMIGRPQHIASHTTLGKPSYIDGKQNMSDLWYSSMIFVVAG